MWGTSRTPYCGAPPNPETLLTRWNLDPILIGLLAAILVVYLAGARRGPGPLSRSRQTAFVGGWAVASLALISPLCPLSVSLFAARVGQHMVLTLVAAPLILLGRPGAALGRLSPHLARTPIPAPLSHPATAAGIFAAALWIWHAPGPYDATFSSPVIYWLMHLSLFGGALLIWSVLLDPPPRRMVPVLAAGAVSTLQMTLLGAIIALTPRLLYAPHAVTPYVWGLTQAQDQRIGGLIMWAPGCAAFLAATLAHLARAMSGRPARPLGLTS